LIDGGMVETLTRSDRKTCWWICCLPLLVFLACALSKASAETTVFWQDHSYTVVVEEIPFRAALRLAVKSKAYLATITSQEEYQTIVNLLISANISATKAGPLSFWLGGSVSSDGWIWSQGPEKGSVYWARGKCLQSFCAWRGAQTSCPSAGAEPDISESSNAISSTESESVEGADVVFSVYNENMILVAGTESQGNTCHLYWNFTWADAPLTNASGLIMEAGNEFGSSPVAGSQTQLSFPSLDPNFLLSTKSGSIGVGGTFVSLTELGGTLTIDFASLTSSDYVVSPFSFVSGSNGNGYEFYLEFNSTIIVWDIGVFNANDMFSFASVPFEIPSDALKWSFSVQNWPFVSQSDSLQLAFFAAPLSPDITGFSNVTTSQDGFEIMLLTFYSAQTTFTLTLLGFAEVINATSSYVVHVDIDVQLTNGQAWVYLTFPYFEGELVYDPLISVLLQPNSGDGSTKLALAIAIPIGVALCLAFVVIVVVLGVVVIVVTLKRRSRTISKRLRTFTGSDAL